MASTKRDLLAGRFFVPTHSHLGHDARERGEQTEFVRWWDETVGRPGGDRQSIVSDRATMLSADEAEALTGLDKVQVSQ